MTNFDELKECLEFCIENKYYKASLLIVGLMRKINPNYEMDVDESMTELFHMETDPTEH